MLSKSQKRIPLGFVDINPAINLRENVRRPWEMPPTDLKKCLICQESGDLTNATEITFKNFVEKFQIRARHNDANYTSLFDRIDLENLDGRQAMWHLRSCYSTFCNKVNVSRLLSRSELLTHDSKKDDLSLPSPISSPVIIDVKLCLFCQKRKPKLPEPSVISPAGNVRADVLGISTTDRTVYQRIQGLDPVGLKYHSSCYLLHLKKHKNGGVPSPASQPKPDMFSELMLLVERGMNRGNAYTIDAITRKYQQMLGSGSTYPAWRLKNRLQEHFGDRVIFVPPQGQFRSTLVMMKTHAHAALANDSTSSLDMECEQAEEELSHLGSFEKNEVLEMYNTSQKIRMDLKATSGITNILDIGEEKAEEVVPTSLTSLLSLIICGDKQPSDAKRRRILAIAQDIVFAQSGGRTLTPKHIGLAVAIHQKTRSKGCVELLATSGHCVSYQTLLRIETSLAKCEIDRFIANDRVYVPLAINPDGPMIQFAVDNIDLNVDSTDGKGSFHATNMAVFQDEVNGREIPVPTVKLGRAKSLKDVPRGLTDTDRFFATPKSKPIPVIPEDATHPEQQDILTAKFDESLMDTMKWLHQQASSTERMETWTDRNKRMLESAPRSQTNVGYMPIINAVAHEFSTLNTVFMRCRKISEKLGQSHTIVTCDEQLYQKGMQLIWSDPDQYQGIILRMGGFHVALNYLKVIGKRFKNAGLSDCWAESGLFGPNTAVKASDGGHYNRSTRGLKITLQALWQLLFEVVTEEHPEVEVVSDMDFDSADPIPEMEEALLLIQTKIAEFDSKHSDGTSRLWRSYMRMAMTFLNFVKADRSGDWILHLLSFEQMLPDFAGYDSYNYLRWGTVYLQQMRALPQTAPEVHEECMAGKFVVKTTDRAFTGISPDMALEHINKSCKGNGGIIGITSKESALQRWCLSVASVNYISMKTYEMLGIGYHEDEETHPEKEHTFKGSLQYTLHETMQVQQLTEQLSQVHPFRQKERNPVNIASADVATNAIAHDFESARTVGEDKVLQFNGCLKDATFHKSIVRIKSKTFVDLYVDRTKTKKADEFKETAKAFHKLFATKASTSEAMKSELTTYPFSILDKHGDIRGPSAKSVICASLTMDIQDHEEIPADGMATMLVVDVMHVVNCMKTTQCATFGDFADNFASMIFRMAVECGATRVDIICDRYEQPSIKGMTRSKRTSKVAPVRKLIKSRQTPFPNNWKSFLALNENKAGMQNFLSEELIRLASGKPYELVSSGGFTEPTKIVSSIGRDVDYMSSTHEEADSRMIVHCKDAKRLDFERVVVSSKDTDVMVLLMHSHRHLPSEVFMNRGTIRSPSYAPIHEFVKLHNNTILENLPAFHAISGCDSTSGFRGHTKTTAWKVYVEDPKLLNGFGVKNPPGDVLASAEKFVVTLYNNKLARKDRSTCETADSQRTHIIDKLRSIQTLPPTSRNLRYHLLR